MVPDAILQPLVDNNVIQLIVIALSFGIVCSKSTADCRGEDYLPIQQTITTLFEAVIRILKWLPGTTLVFGIVARTVALKGFEPFKALGALIIAALFFAPATT